jgi:hypothetical protein
MSNYRTPRTYTPNGSVYTWDPTSPLSGTTTNGTSTTITVAPSTWSSSSVWHYPMTIQVGTCKIEEVDGECWWVRADGSRTQLTGKGRGFSDLYDKLNENP